jgi:hypothetical protein
VKTSEEEIFYLNFDTLEMQKCHPLDEQFKVMFFTEKAKQVD